MHRLPFIAILVLFLLPASAIALDDVSTVQVASGLNRPIYVTAPEGDYERLFIVEQRGVIRILNIVTGELLATNFLDIDSKVAGPDSSGDERGLLGLAFHPDYAKNGAFFVHYTANSGDGTLARYFVDKDDPNKADADSGHVLLSVDDPYSNHNGGSIAFSPIDGYLYIAFGDGGSANDPGDRAQDGEEMLGKMHRLDVNDLDADDYAIPTDNPFVDDADVLDEIWALGLRNPYRWSFDRVTGDLYIADVGQGAQEEVDFQPFDSTGGENYGWCCVEGFADTGLSHCTCPDESELTEPITSYSHSGGRCSITGGYNYRGTAIPALDGVYFYADYCSSDIYVLKYDGATVSGDENVTSDIAPGGGLSISAIAGFGEDAYGEMYIVERGGTSSGEIFKIVPAGISDLDCNSNYILDSEELAHGVAEDCDGDGAIDGCGAIARLKPSDGMSDEEFGTSVALTAEIAVCGAPKEGDLGVSSGAAYVYRYSGSWSEEQKLLASDGIAGAEFGRDVAASGDRIVVGAGEAEIDGIDSGAAYVFEYSPLSGEWTETAQLFAEDGSANANFGETVAIDGDVIVIGARLDDEAGSNSGAAYVYRYDGGEWVMEQKLAPADLAGFDEFGCSVAIDGDFIAVGSRHDDDGASNAGSAYVFRHGGGTWHEEDKVTATETGVGAEFGAAVAISGDRLIVGSPLLDEGGSNAGGVYAYTRDDLLESWGSEQFIVAEATVAGDQLGWSLAIDGAGFVAGANMADPHGASSGAVLSFFVEDATGTWVESPLTPLIPSVAGEFVGTSVAISELGLIAGAPFGATASTDSGSAFVILTQDCNQNGVVDACEVIAGGADDCNTNFVPDECEIRFRAQPRAQNVPAGSDAVFSVEVSAAATATLQWRKDALDLDGETSATLTIAAADEDDAGSYDVVVTDGCLSATSAAAELSIDAEIRFKRGDANNDGEVSAISDALFVLSYGFLGGTAPACMDAADVNDDGSIGPIQDALRILNWGFLGGDPPPAPGPDDCGVDPGSDALDCDATATSCL